MTQVELSRQIDISQPLISNYESGKLRPPHEFILKFANLVDVSTDQILGRGKQRGGAEEPAIERRFLRRMKVVQGLPKRDQDALLRTIDAFITARAR